MTIQGHEELAVYQIAFEMAMQIFELSKRFPVEERYSLTDQMLAWGVFRKSCQPWLKPLIFRQTIAIYTKI